MRKLLKLSKSSPTYDLFKRQLYKLDNGRCHICHKPINYDEITFDHIIPVSFFKQNDSEVINDYWNLRIAHKACNGSRGQARLPGQLRLPLATSDLQSPEPEGWLSKKRIRHIEILKQLTGLGLETIEFWRQYKILLSESKTCQNCYHYQEFNVCSCRDSADVIHNPNKCTDWLPQKD